MACDRSSRRVGLELRNSRKKMNQDFFGMIVKMFEFRESLTSLDLVCLTDVDMFRKRHWTRCDADLGLSPFRRRYHTPLLLNVDVFIAHLATSSPVTLTSRGAIHSTFTS